MWGSAARIDQIVPIRLVSTISRAVSAVMSRKSAYSPIPALAMTASQRPWRSMVA